MTGHDRALAPDLDQSAELSHVTDGSKVAVDKQFSVF